MPTLLAKKIRALPPKRRIN